MLSATLTLADGRQLRFGPDEADDADVPMDVSFETNNPGGFGSARLTLPRPAQLKQDETKLFSEVILYGDAGRILYEGLVVGVPQAGRDFIRLELAGWVTVLDRHETFREIFVDRDVSRWQPIPTERRQLLMAFTQRYQDPSSEGSDTGAPTLKLALSTSAAAAVNCEAIYDAGPGLEVGSIYYTYVTDSSAASQPSASFGLVILTMDETYTFTGGSTTADLHTVTASSGSALWEPATPCRYAGIRWTYTGALGDQTYDAVFGPLAVFGNHGLTKRGSAPYGFWASDIVEYALSQCPSLNYISGESIETTGFVIPHLTFTEDTTLRSVIEQVTALGGNNNVANDWGVYEGRQFFWRSPGTYGRTWYVRRDEVAELAADGPDADQRVAGIKVSYQDAVGRPKSVGPPGSGADYETTDLVDSDPDNPAHRIDGAWASESVGITSQTGAVNIGVMILNERNRQDWRGSVTVSGEVTDQYGNPHPAAMVRAGDRIVVTDSEDPTARTIVGTSYEHDSLSVRCDIGAAPDSLESLLGRLALVTDLVN